MSLMPMPMRYYCTTAVGFKRFQSNNKSHQFAAFAALAFAFSIFPCIRATYFRTLASGDASSAFTFRSNPSASSLSRHSRCVHKFPNENSAIFSGDWPSPAWVKRSVSRTSYR